MRRRVLLVCVALTAVAVAGCSVVDNGRVERIDPPLGLDDTLPTTSTSTTVVSDGSTTTVALTTTTVEETTTTNVQTEQVRLYFVSAGLLSYVTIPLPMPVALNQVVAALRAGPSQFGELGTGLRTAMPAGEEVTATNDGTGVARVSLPDGFFDTIALGDQRLVIAQLVLTLTDTRNVGQVSFDRTVPLPNGELADPGAPLTKVQFQELLATSSGGG